MWMKDSAKDGWRVGRPGVERQSRRWALVAALLLALGALLAACGTPQVQGPSTHLPGGMYSNAQYHFKISYPTGWQVNAVAPSPGPDDIVPLTVEITRSSDRQASESLVSTFTIAVFDAGNATFAANATPLAADTTKHAVQIAGQPGYADTPVQQQVPGTAITATHADYYLIHGSYEYQLSTDDVSSDDASPALASMLQSFTLLP